MKIFHAESEPVAIQAFCTDYHFYCNY